MFPGIVSLGWILGKNTEEIPLEGKVWYVMEGITLGIVPLYHAKEVGGSEWIVRTCGCSAAFQAQSYRIKSVQSNNEY